MTRIPSFTKCLRPSTFQIAVCLKLSQPWVHLHGRVFFILKILIERNGRWRMGDGKKIWLFHDAWLPNSNAGRIIFHKGILAQTATADGLIDPNSGWWNLGLID